MAGRREIDGNPILTKVSLFQIPCKGLLLVLDFDVCMTVEFVCIHGISTFPSLFFVFLFLGCLLWVGFLHSIWAEGQKIISFPRT